MPDHFDPLMDLSSAKNQGTTSGGTTSPSGSKTGPTYVSQHDPAPIAATTKDHQGPTTSPAANQSKVPPGVDTFSGGSV